MNDELARLRGLAREITSRRNGLLQEEANLRDHHPSYARSKRDRQEEGARINGMVIALTHALGRPLDMKLAEAFIADDPNWHELLDPGFFA